MKTVKDVYAQYKGWPRNDMTHVIVSDVNDISFITYMGNPVVSGNALVYTREQYEQYKAEQESDVETKCDWYDYDKCDVIDINLIPKGTEVELHNDKQLTMHYGHDLIGETCEVITIADDVAVLRASIGKVCFSADLIRPLDHDKHTAKVAPMDWLVGSGIDCEFSDNKECWEIGFLNRIDSDTRPFLDNLSTFWKYCRPRMNHKHVLTDEQVKLIPDCFEYTIHQVYGCNNGVTVRLIYNIVEFKGLKEGYKFAHEVNS